MRFATRTFLWSFVPIVLLLIAGFWVVRSAAVATIRAGLRAAARDNQVALARVEARSEDRNQTTLRAIAENPALKAGLDLLGSEKDAPTEARNTVADQLSEICQTLQYDFMMVSNARGEPVAAVTRQASGFAPVELAGIAPADRGIVLAGGSLYEVASVPMFEDIAQAGTLSMGSVFDISRFGVPAVLLHNGRVAASELRELAPSLIQTALRPCLPDAECEVRIRDQVYLSLPIAPGALRLGGGYSLRSLQNLDTATAHVQAVLQRVFLTVGFAVLVAALGIGLLTSRSIARPLAEMAARLRCASATGELPDFPESVGAGLEIRELTRGFDQAAKAVREARERLTRAYVEFVGSLAQALDARDPYTAGHSRRVSNYACAIAEAMGLAEPEVETIRVGALLHDLGKIGISDVVLHKPGRLTADETDLIRQHPVIGRRILDNVHGLEPYLGIVELHHENWDGSGYPRGLKGAETPLEARIVKVADSYDAMTSDRPYRRGMTHAQAMAILRKVSGSETDTEIVEAFSRVCPPGSEGCLETTGSLERLAGVVAAQHEGIAEGIAGPVPKEAA
ncbi:MAG TPA: HD domain-containing phosphohydrolase [Bryobacteraceae bacterium]